MMIQLLLNELEEKFNSTDFLKITNLKRDLYIACKMFDNEDILSKIVKLKMIISEIEQKGVQIDDCDICWIILSDLPKEYCSYPKLVVTANFNSELIINTTIQEYRRNKSMSRGIVNQDELLLNQCYCTKANDSVKANDDINEKCHNKEGFMHRCFKCGNSGHIVKYCRNRNDTDKERSKADKKKEGNNKSFFEMLSLFENKKINHSNKDIWYLDSASTNNIGNNRESFADCETLKKPTKKFSSNSTSTKAIRRGIVILRTRKIDFKQL